MSSINKTYRPVTWQVLDDYRVSDLDYGRIKHLCTQRVYQAVTRHDVAECFQLLSLLAKDTSIDPYILFRLVMILIESNQPERVDKNATVYLETQLNKLVSLCRPEIFTEFLSHFMKFNHLEYFNEIYSQRHRFMQKGVHRQLPYVVTNMHCYDFLYNYINWQSRDKVEFDLSIQGWLVNLMESLQGVQGNYEYFVMCFLDVLLYYRYDKKAYLYVSKYYRDNPNNLSAQLLMYKLLVCLDSKKDENMSLSDTDLSALERRREKGLRRINNFRINSKRESFRQNRFPVRQDRELLIKNIRLLDPTRGELIKLSRWTGSIRHDPVERLEILMDGLEYEREITNLSRWKKIKRLLVEIMDADLDLTWGDVQRLTNLWRTKYYRYWTIVDFVGIYDNKRDEDDEEDCQVIQDVIILLSGMNPNED